MASQGFPPRRSSQQTARLRAEESASPSNPDTCSRTLSSSSAESQSFLLNNPQASTTTSSQTAQPQPSTEPPKSEPRTCWICQMDDTEDTPETSTWRTPCPCSLTAHDDCLLEWIANEEAPKPGEIAHNHKIICPQCKAEIKIQRPRDYLVAVVDRINRSARELMWPTVVSGLAGCLYSGLLVYGYNTVQIVFGHDEARNILGRVFTGGYNRRPWARNMVTVMRKSLTVFDPFFPDAGYPPNMKIFLGLPLIGPSLIILRTRFADQAFALLLPLYFLDPAHRDILHWPPPPGLTFATVPYIRTAYNELYKHTVGPLEKKWELAVQRKPREGETAEQIAAQAAEEEEGEVIFELEFGHDHEEDEAEEAVRRWNERNRGQVPPGNNIPANPAEAPVNVAEGQAAAEGAQPPQGRNRDNGGWDVRHREDISIPQVASTVMGALFFPMISSMIGDLLKVTLPSKWVGKGVGFGIANKDGGLLKEKWGRTLVGGCLFVVLKDVVTLYCKWRKAKDFGKRKVLDYVGKKKKGRA